MVYTSMFTILLLILLCIILLLKRVSQKLLNRPYVGLQNCIKVCENKSMIKFNFNKEKAREAVLYLANKKPNIDKLQLLKFLFYADKYHLNRYDRPILGGHYTAMPKGPVLSELYDEIKTSCLDYILKGNEIKPLREANLIYFSKSDIEALDYALCQYSQYSGTQLSELTHNDKAWINTRAREPKSKNATIPYEDFFDEIDDEKLEFLREYAHLMVI